ncbi:MAG: exosortase system-associated protein, TIGR04073 family [Verrucomicrobiales bacterium]|nr:exosortase system-associated protein, TIGR04073 family [Verrucomicrobiales bacterium]
MKKLIISLFCVGIVSLAQADIQAPPKSQYTATRKLSRGIANILYGWTELPNSIIRLNENQEQSTMVVVYGIVNGIKRTGVRMGYGVYEVINFQRPLYKDSFRAPYKSKRYAPVSGYEEFPGQIGYLSTINHTRQGTY